MEENIEKVRQDVEIVVRHAGLEAGKKLLEEFEAGRIVGAPFLALDEEDEPRYGCVIGYLAYHAGYIKREPGDVTYSSGPIVMRGVDKFLEGTPFSSDIRTSFENALFERGNYQALNAIRMAVEDAVELMESEVA